jgi:predicted nucleic-acid-binding protein
MYGFAASDCATSIEALMGSSVLGVDRQAVRAGLKLPSACGHFANGLIAYAGRALGVKQLTTFDREAAPSVCCW